MNVVICGGGIIGCSCAYYLAKRNISCTIIEQEEIACAASGKAGGFLSRTWCETNLCDDLAKLSYKLHMDLAKEFFDVDYRCVNTYSASVDNLQVGSQKRVSKVLSWVDGPITKQSLLETDKNTAQVHPKKLCKRLFHESQRMTQYQTKILYDKVVGMEFDDSGPIPAIKGVKLESGSIVNANVVLISMGPWSQAAAEMFPKGCIPKIKGHRAHSIVLKMPESVKFSADCLFLQYKNVRGVTSPEIYPRPDGTVYVSGLGDEKELPDKASEVEVEKWRCNQLREVAYATCSSLESSEKLAEQACYLPLAPDGLPVIGAIKNVKGAYIATGHSCWGILNSTGTGYAMAELISTGDCKALNLKPFNSNRFH